MEEIISVVPLLLAATSLIVTLVGLRDRAEAEKKFVQALQEELKKAFADMKAPEELKHQVAKLAELSDLSELSESAEKIGNNDPALVRAIYREALRSSGVNPGGIVLKALNDLAEKDKTYISSTLKANSVAGRFRYLAKLFRKAFQGVH